MKRTVVFKVLALVVATGLLGGWSSKKGRIKKTAGTSSSGSVTISYACWDSAQADKLRKVADDFEKANPGIKIDIQVSGWNDYWTGLEAAATGGSLPDTFWMHSNNIYYYASNGQLLDLTKYIKKSSDIDLSKYPAGLVSIYSLNGKQYAIPKDYDTIALWYNKTLFDKAGLSYPDETWTWDTMKKAAKKLTKSDGSQYGMCAGLHNQEGYYNFVYQSGGEIVTPGNKSGYAEDATIKGIDEYFSFVKEGLSPQIYDDQARSQAIMNGQCAMGLFGSWNLSGFAANNFMKKNFNCAVLPSANDGKRATIFNGLGNAIAATTKHPDEAWKWIEYLSSEAGQKKQAELGIAISAYKGTAGTWTKAYPDFNVKCYIDMLPYAHIRPYTHQTSVWEDKSYEMLKGAYAGKEEVSTACKKTAQMMNEAIAAE
jgi:multiple sugar transport system substrate-binding protein